jgi:hypothetical protein
MLQNFFIRAPELIFNTQGAGRSPGLYIKNINIIKKTILNFRDKTNKF